jgi:hypothetical protein
VTKTQSRLKAAYLRLLKQTGFRGWSAANERRGNLIDLSIRRNATNEEEEELATLQQLADAYVRYKTNDSLRRQNRRLERMLASIDPTGELRGKP